MIWYPRIVLHIKKCVKAEIFNVLDDMKIPSEFFRSSEVIASHTKLYCHPWKISM